MKALLVRPRFDDPTQYTFGFAAEILQWCREAGINLVELAEDKATRAKVEEEIRRGIDLYIHYNHGSENTLYGQGGISAVDLSNCHLLTGKEIYTLACLSAKSLGVEVWRQGGKYWGYVDVVSFTTDALDRFKESFNCGFRYLFIEGDRQNALSRAKDTFNRLTFELVGTGKMIAAICMRENGQNLRYYDTNAPDSGCQLRRMLIKVLGQKRGWASPSPKALIYRVYYWFWHDVMKRPEPYTDTWRRSIKKHPKLWLSIIIGVPVGISILLSVLLGHLGGFW